MQVQRLNVIVAGDACDVHAVLESTPCLAAPGHRERVAWCGVYVYPVTFAGPDKAACHPLVAGYWYEPADAEALLTTLGVFPS